jgi:glyoxalase family protein
MSVNAMHPGDDAELYDTPGLHHVTAMVGDARGNLEFYTDALGLRLVKRTVNYEDMLRYHLYYGNGTADLGTLFTCFPYPDEVPARRGKPGIEAVAFAVPPGSLDYWDERLTHRGVDVEGSLERFGEAFLRFTDPAGVRVELVAADSPVAPWTDGGVPERAAIRGLHGVTLLPVTPYATAGLLETLGFERVGQAGDRIRYRAGGDHAAVVDVLDREATYGREGQGTIHHLAVRVGSEAELYGWHALLRERDYDVSRVRDRNYFKSLYVREPGGILFELATETPGLTADEGVDELGSSLVLPDWFADQRDLIESQLPPLGAVTGSGGDGG